MSAVTGYHLSPSSAVLRLREEFPDFLICELSGAPERPYFVATRTRTATGGQPPLIVRPCPDQLRQALITLEGGPA